ncbi:chaperonin 10-like protein [Lipomyces starkeyi]
MTTQTQKAIVIQAPKVAELVTDRPLPTLRDDYILVETVAVALNPTDWKSIDFRGCSGALVGCDYAGIVGEVGKAVTKPFKKGDRVCGFVHGSNGMQHEDGTFAEYIVVKEAATLGHGVATVGQGLYQALKLPLPSAPSKEKIPILIYGGSSASGSLGAAAFFDYKDPDSVTKICEFANNNLKFAWDTISSESSAKFCADVLSSTGGKYAALLDIRAPRDDVDSCWTIAYTIFGEPFAWPPASIPAVAEDYEFGTKWSDIVSKLLLDNKIKAHKQSVGKEGLKGVLEGLQLLRENKVSGEKLVYHVGETPLLFDNIFTLQRTHCSR